MEGGEYDVFVFLVDLQIVFWNYLPWWADIATSTKQLELSTPEKNTGYETQHPSWFKSMKKASSQKKNTQNSFGLLWFFSQTQDKKLFIVHIEGIVHSVHIVHFAYIYIVHRTFCAMAILT